MKLYLISQNVNNDYDTYDSAVVAATSEEEARMMNPNGMEWDGTTEPYDSWCDAKDVKIEYIGETHLEKGVVCASYNAG